MPDDASILVQHLATMQEALSDHNTYVVAQITAARQALEVALQQVSAQVVGLETAMASLVPLLTRVVEYVEKQPKEQPKPKIASYVELYPELRTEAPDRPASGTAPPSAPRVSRWTRLFPKKELA
jgi:hypothetical protein